MKVLHVLDHSLPVQSGYTFRSAAIMREQQHLGWDVLALTGPKHGPWREPIEDVGGARIHRTPVLTGLPARLPVVDQLAVVQALRSALRRLIATERPDVVHAHSPCLNGLAALGLGVPVVYEMRSSWEDAAVSSGTTTEGSLRYRASRWLETRTLLRADAVVTICEGLRAEVLARGVPQSRVAVVPNAVDSATLVRKPGTGAAVRARYDLDDKLVIGFIGSFFAWEGLLLLIETMPTILAARPDARLLFVGGGPDEANMRALVTRLGLDNTVIFAGRTGHDEIDAMYDAVDILAYPRLPIRLTEMVTPLKPLEAMALEVNFVASDVGGHRELVRNDDTGVLFPAGDGASLARTIVALAEDPNRRQRLRARGLQFVREERTWTRVVAGYVPVYRRFHSGNGT